VAVSDGDVIKVAENTSRAMNLQIQLAEKEKEVAAQNIVIHDLEMDKEEREAEIRKLKRINRRLKCEIEIRDRVME